MIHGRKFRSKSSGRPVRPNKNASWSLQRALFNSRLAIGNSIVHEREIWRLRLEEIGLKSMPLCWIACKSSHFSRRPAVHPYLPARCTILTSQGARVVIIDRADLCDSSDYHDTCTCVYSALSSNNAHRGAAAVNLVGERTQARPALLRSWGVFKLPPRLE